MATIPKHDHATLHFPEGFLWGAATSAHQVEGNNINSDWWEWEQKTQPEDKRSGATCDQYNRYEEDFDLIKQLGHNAHRLSIEWSRIEPEEGVFNKEAIDHYKAELKALKDRGITIMLTLHHLTNPLWFAKKGGWENWRSPYYFERFVKKIVPEIHEYVDLWVTINEPGVAMWGGYLWCIWPPQKKSNIAALKVMWNQIRAHKKGYKAIHKLVPYSKVGVVQQLQAYTAFHKHSLIEQLGVIFLDFAANHFFYVFSKGYHDFLGINYYLYLRLKRKGLFPQIVDVSELSKDVTDMGWEINPEGMFQVLTDMADGIPIYITECGIATENDDRRIRFMMQYLQEIYRAIQSGVDVKGFFYWSLLDNLEWERGFEPKFGLVEVDYKTQERKIRPSALVYADIIKNNGIRHHLMKFLGHRVHVSEVLDVNVKTQMSNLHPETFEI